MANGAPPAQSLSASSSNSLAAPGVRWAWRWALRAACLFTVAAAVAVTWGCTDEEDATPDELIETTHRFVQVVPTHPGGASELNVTAAFVITFQDGGDFDVVLQTFPEGAPITEQTGGGTWERDGEVVVATLTEVAGEAVEARDYVITFEEGFISDIQGPNIEGLSQNWLFLLGAGDRHPSIVELHDRLAAVDYLDFEPPQADAANLYSEQTRRAVVRFQEAEGLIPSGVVSILTWRRLEAPRATAPAPPAPTVALPEPSPTLAPPEPTPTVAAPEPPPAPTPPPPPPPPPADGAVVYLTFDDGPLSPYTEQVMGLLAQYNARATFFLIGQQVLSYGPLVAQESQAGHATANHTFDHLSLEGASTDVFLSQVDSTQQAIVGAGGTATSCLRPPYGATDANTAAMAAQLGYQIVLWTMDTQDWRQPGTDQIVQYVLDNISPGAVILMHDAGGNRDQTVEALRTLLPTLTGQGYRFESLC